MTWVLSQLHARKQRDIQVRQSPTLDNVIDMLTPERPSIVHGVVIGKGFNGVLVQRGYHFIFDQKRRLNEEENRRIFIWYILARAAETKC